MIRDYMGSVTTKSGSVYSFWHVKTTTWVGWLVKGLNIPNPGSETLGKRYWPIDKPMPWPPEIGKGLTFFSRHFKNKEHHLRMPGGGKYTTNIVSVEDIDNDA